MTEVSAVRLAVSPEAVVTWELALSSARSRGCYGTTRTSASGVDNGMGCIVEMAGNDRLGPAYKGFVEAECGGPDRS
ncbi:hypothetical protein [Streptomyces sp. TR06-5]|uniref:hypothetical protein n=1 Tax=Streptomyces sp. TR06-5 TaxID=3385976 RepID=UPI0039A1CC7E